MILNRGDIVLTRFPHAGGNRGKKRPAVIIQADVYNASLKHFIVAEVRQHFRFRDFPRTVIAPDCAIFPPIAGGDLE